jgi:hypothetical protein
VAFLVVLVGAARALKQMYPLEEHPDDAAYLAKADKQATENGAAHSGTVG